MLLWTGSSLLYRLDGQVDTGSDDEEAEHREEHDQSNVNDIDLPVHEETVVAPSA